MVTPTGYTALDLVGFTDKGPYSALENYVKNDLAHYAGSIWRCKIDDTTNVTPAENANWTVFVSDRSDLVEASIAPIETSPATAPHAQGSQLFYNDTLYKAKTAIAIGDSLVVGTNIEAAPKVTTQLEAKANTADLGTAAAKNSTNAVTSGSADLVTSGGVYASEQDIYEVMGQMGAKNLLYANIDVVKTINQNGTWSGNAFAHSNGITFSCDVDNNGYITKVTANGTSTGACFLNLWNSSNNKFELPKGNYILSGCPSGGNFSSKYCLYAYYNEQYAIDIGDGANINSINDISTQIIILVNSNNTISDKVFYPMIRLASDTDSTYVPYAKTNQQLTEDTTSLLDNLEVNGAVNMLPYPYKRGDEVINGITSVVNNDGVITLNGTATAATSFIMFERAENKFALPKGSYKAIVKIVSGTYTNTLSHILRATEGGSGIVKVDKNLGEAGIFSISTDTYIGYQVNIPSGCVLTNLKLAPMLTVPSYNGDYVPYAKSNKELTEYVKPLKLSFTYPSSITSDLDLIKEIFIDCVAYLNSVGDGAFGSIMWTSHGYRGFQIEKVTSTGYKGIIYQENKIWTANYNSSNDTLSVYSYTGTAVT